MACEDDNGGGVQRCGEIDVQSLGYLIISLPFPFYKSKAHTISTFISIFTHKSS